MREALVKTQKMRVLSCAAIGNGLELYDFTLYGLMLPFISMRFFPVDNPLISLLIGYLTFALTFLVAPLGSIFWGWYGDKIGRAQMLKTSMLLMALPSLGIACLPTYESIGLFAPVILIALRILQGVSAGGVIMGAKLFAMDNLGYKNHGLCSGVISASGAAGVLLAVAMVFFTAQMPSDSEYWRVPFLLGSGLFIIAQKIRRLNLPESTNAESVKLRQIMNIIFQNKQPSWVVFILGAYLGVASYAMHAFVNNYLLAQGLAEGTVYLDAILGLMATMLGALLAAWLLDYTNKNTAYLSKLILILSAILYVPLFVLLLQDGSCTLVAYLSLGFLLGAYAAVSAVLMYRIFPQNTRYRGVLFAYALGCSIFGGLTPVIMQSLSLFGFLTPALFPAASAALSFILIKNIEVKEHADLF